MSESYSSHGRFEGESHGFKNSPRSVIDSYFSHRARPTPEEMEAAANIIAGAYREIERTGDALSIWWDLVGGVHDATTVLAGMFSVDHEAIPAKWRADAELTRDFLLMTGDIECGRLRAQQRPIMRGPSFPGLSERLAEVEQFADALQQ